VLYTIIGHDVDNSSEKRRATRARHLEHLQPLMDDGRVVFAGPHPAIDSPDPGPAGFTGSLIIAEFKSVEDARAWAAQDPYSQEGVFESVTVKPVLQAYP
jgi:uncharacterized protein